MKLLAPLILALMLSASGFAQNYNFTGGGCSDYAVPRRVCDVTATPGLSLHFDAQPATAPGLFIGTITLTAGISHISYAWSGYTDGLTYTGSLDNGGSLSVTTKSEYTLGRYRHQRWVVTTGTLTLPVAIADGGAPFPNCSPHCCGKKLGDPNICDPDRKLWEGVGL